MTAAAPSYQPEQRQPDEIAPGDSYQRGDEVWVHRHGEWHTGVVEGASPTAVIVTYQPRGMRGTVVDTVPPANLTHRQPPVAGPGPVGGEQ